MKSDNKLIDNPVIYLKVNLIYFWTSVYPVRVRQLGRRPSTPRRVPLLRLVPRQADQGIHDGARLPREERHQPPPACAAR